MIYVIYILTKFKILNWKKRRIIENLVSSYIDRYIFTIGKYIIRLHYDYHFIPTTHHISVNNKILSRNDIIHKIERLLRTYDFKYEYIKSGSSKLCNDLKESRLVKMGLLKKEILIID